MKLMLDHTVQTDMINLIQNLILILNFISFNTAWLM